MDEGSLTERPGKCLKLNAPSAAKKPKFHLSLNWTKTETPYGQFIAESVFRSEDNSKRD